MSEADAHREPSGGEEPASSTDAEPKEAGQPVQLHAIDPEGGGIETRCFSSPADAADWVRRWNGKRNIYVTVNPLRASMDRKPKKQDIAALAQLHVDLDRKGGESAEDCVQRNLAKLRTFVPRPSRIVLSGNGVNAYWRLAVPVPIEGKDDAERVASAEKLEAYNKAIGGALGADACFNIDRILRLPGTLNIPTKPKRARGYVVCETKLLHEDKTLACKLEDFAHLLPEADSGAQEKQEGAGTKAGSSRQREEAVHLDRLDDIEALWGEDERTVKLRKLIETGDLTLRLNPKRAGEPYPSRSEAGIAVVLRLLSLGVSASVIRAVFLDARWAIGAYVREKANPGAAIEAEIKRAREKLGAAQGGKGFEMRSDGLWYEPGGDKSNVWVGGPFEILGELRSSQGTSWGIYLQWHDRENRRHTWAMSSKLLVGDGIAVREELVDRGLKLGTSRAARELLSSYLMAAKPKTLIRCATKTGWHDGCYVLPDDAIGSADDEPVILQTAHPLSAGFEQAGTLEGWQHDVARPCLGNSRLVFCVSLAFAAAIFGPLGLEGGGFHLVGPSSIGKTTALAVANSVWRERIGSWRTTDNALEGTAAEHNDALLCLDELSEVDARAAGATAYMLANGRGKGRADRSGAARKSAQWKLLFLSTGEQSLADKVREDRWSAAPRAGQAVRFVELPADAGKGLGLFETLHGFASAQALADHLKEAVGRQHGTAARAFIEGVAADPDRAKNFMKATIKEITEEICPPEADGQVKRVAARFALVAAAGEQAIKLGVVPWEEKDAATGARVCFKAWLAARGSTGPQEIEDAIRQVLDGLAAHGSSRFEDFPTTSATTGEPVTTPRIVANRLGWRCQDDAGYWEYLLLPQGFAELARGYSVEATARAMAARKLLIPDPDGRHMAIKTSVPGYKRQRLYRIPASSLSGDRE
jgi:putative DNA primase/helicase